MALAELGTAPKRVAASEVRRMSLVSSKVLLDSLRRLNPLSLKRNPVMLLVELTFFIVLGMATSPQAFVPVASVTLRPFYVDASAILLITVCFSTFSAVLAETQDR